jgi:hypothetical protein
MLQDKFHIEMMLPGLVDDIVEGEELVESDLEPEVDLTPVVEESSMGYALHLVHAVDVEQIDLEPCERNNSAD